MAYEQLEKLAADNLNEAILLERRGSRNLAVMKYQRAIEVLQKLSDLYPTSPQNKIYLERVHACQHRLDELQSNNISQAGQMTKTIPKPDEFPVARDIDVRWKDIANLSDAKKIIEESIIFPARRPDLFPHGWPRGILFYGPPGCGKTLLAAAIATEIEATFFDIGSCSIISKWLGESEKNVAQLFEDAKAATASKRPAIIFIDEVDALMGVRNHEVGGEVRARDQFLNEMDGISAKNTKSLVYVIGATNKPWDLDEPFVRRFQRRIYVPLPEREARIEMFKLNANGLSLSGDVDFERLSDLTDGRSGSDIRDIFQFSQTKVVRALFESAGAFDPTSTPRSITMSDLEEAVTRCGRTVSSRSLSRFLEWESELKRT